MDRFIIFESFYQYLFFISLGQIIFILVDLRINQFDIISHIVQVYLLMFIQKVMFELKNVIFHQALLVFVVKNQYQSLFSIFLFILNTLYRFLVMIGLGFFLGAGG
jgi:hypothetical protein